MRERVVLYAGLRDRLFGVPGQWTLKQCLACGSVYLDPRPTKESIHYAYETYLTHAEGRNAAGLSGPRLIARSVANGYRNVKFGTSYAPANSLGYSLVTLLPSISRLFDTEGRDLMPPTPGASLLDVGCGNGDFLQLASHIGWQAIGLDSDPRAVAVARAKGLNVILGDIQSLPSPQSFHAICLSHVIEHVHDPVALLRKCHDLLAPSGLLWVETPNLESLGHRLYRHNWRGLEVPRHLTLFNPGSLTSILIKAGFGTMETERWRPTCWYMFNESESIAAAESGRGRRRIRPLVRAWLAERHAKGRAPLREFLTFRASKVAPS